MIDSSGTATQTTPRGPLQGLSEARHLPLILFISALVLAYGFEIFSFNLTVDEDSTAPVGRLERASWSVAEGRWGMALLTLLIPSPIAPVVSNGIGVALSGTAWWMLSRRYLSMPRWHAAFAASLAGTIPVLAFIFSFSTIAFAIGVGNLLLVGFIAGISAMAWWRRALGVLSAAAAVAIYDTFLVAVVALAIAVIMKTPKLRTVAIAMGAAILSYLLARLITLGSFAVTGVEESAYTSAFFDLPGLIASPKDRTVSAVGDLWNVLALSTERFVLSSPWLIVSTLAILVLAFAAVALSGDRATVKLIRFGALIALVLLPIGVEAIASVVVLRSMFYLPIVLIVLSSVASPLVARVAPPLRTVLHCIMGAVIVLAVIGNATVTNRSFGIAATTYAIDQDLAFHIGQEKLRLSSEPQDTDMPVVVSGLHGWPQGALTTQRETLGMSFFDLAPSRTVSFLRAHGVVVHLADENEQRAVEATLREMPEYPQDGWIAVENGILLLNFHASDE